MNGIEKITARIEEDGRKENDALLAEARAQAAEISAKYQAEAKAVTDEVLSQGRAAAQARAGHLDSMAQMECRKAVLAAKQDVIEEAFQAAHKKLLELPSEQYVALLANLAAKASVTGQEKLIFSPSHRAQVGKAVVVAANEKIGPSAALTLSEESRPMDGGFILSDGAVEVNCTFDTLIRLQRGALAGEVAKVLFDGPSPFRLE